MTATPAQLLAALPRDEVGHFVLSSLTLGEQLALRAVSHDTADLVGSVCASDELERSVAIARVPAATHAAHRPADDAFVMDHVHQRPDVPIVRPQRPTKAFLDAARYDGHRLRAIVHSMNAPLDVVAVADSALSHVPQLARPRGNDNELQPLCVTCYTDAALLSLDWRFLSTYPTLVPTGELGHANAYARGPSFTTKLTLALGRSTRRFAHLLVAAGGDTATAVQRTIVALAKEHGAVTLVAADGDLGPLHKFDGTCLPFSLPDAGVHVGAARGTVPLWLQCQSLRIGCSSGLGVGEVLHSLTLHDASRVRSTLCALEVEGRWSSQEFSARLAAWLRSVGDAAGVDAVLATVALRGNGLHDSVASALVGLAGGLTELDLSCVNVDVSTFTAVLCVAKDAALRSLALPMKATKDHAEAVGAAASCSQLRALNLSNVAASVPAAVACCVTTLQHLTAPGAPDALVAVLADAPQCSLVTLRTPRTSATDAVLTRLLRDTGTAACLEHLSVPLATHLSDVSLRQLAQCPRLASLDVSDTSGRVTDATVMAVAMACPHLAQLTARGANGHVSDAALLVVAQHSHDLTALDVKLCDGKITERGLRAVALGCPRLRYVFYDRFEVDAKLPLTGPLRWTAFQP